MPPPRLPAALVAAFAGLSVLAAAAAPAGAQRAELAAINSYIPARIDSNETVFALRYAAAFPITHVVSRAHPARAAAEPSDDEGFIDWRKGPEAARLLRGRGMMLAGDGLPLHPRLSLSRKRSWRPSRRRIPHRDRDVKRRASRPGATRGDSACSRRRRR